MENLTDRWVFIVDDEEEDRRELQAILSRAGYNIRMFSNGAELLDALPTLPKGCVLLDVRMPEKDGLDVVEVLGPRLSEYPVVMVSGQSTIPTAVKALHKGALHFLEKPVETRELLSWVSQAFHRSAKAEMANAPKYSLKQLSDKITRREMQVLQLLVAGYSNKTIAYELGISEKTVEVHRHRVMRRLEVKSFAELVRLAVEAGI